MSTLQEIKDAAGGLPAEQRSELAAWLSESSDVLEMQHERLRRDIQIGLDQISRGEVAPLNMTEIKAKARARWESERAN